jgi:hypothetical protein
MSSSKKMYFSAGVYLPQAPNPIPPLTLCIIVYVYTDTYSHRELGEGGELDQREGERGNRGD